MIPHSENKNEPTKRTLLAGGLLLVLVNLGGYSGFSASCGWVRAPPSEPRSSAFFARNPQQD